MLRVPIKVEVNLAPQVSWCAPHENGDGAAGGKTVRASVQTLQITEKRCGKEFTREKERGGKK